MLKLERTQICGLEPAMRGARNPMNSWAKSDSVYCTDRESCEDCPCRDVVCDGGCSRHELEPFVIGPNDHDLAMRLRNAGTDHRKYMRMIVVYVDVTAPLYFWKEADQYKVGTTTNSCSTMHKIHAKEFVLDDFSHEHLSPRALDRLMDTIKELNYWRDIFINGGTDDSTGVMRIYEPKDKDAWWQMIQLLPSSYNQMRTWMLNYEVLADIYNARKNHKLDCWREVAKWIENLPYSEFITGHVEENAR